MRYARNIGAAVVGIFIVVLGVRGLVGFLDSGVRPPVPSSPPGSFLTAPHATISIAKFSSGNRLDNCADVTFRAGHEINPGKLEARGFVVLKSTCAKTFPNSFVFASCTRSDLDNDAEPATEAVGYYYDVATLEGDDTYRGQCLGSGGSWVVKRDDPQYVEMRARTASSKPRHEIDSLMELSP
ncbi:MAG: hypothetical protein ABSF69_19775 [Polyangiaceae bacterium]|jgi:hypothetical protein